MAEQRVFDGVESVKAAVGEHLGYSEWLEITQERINQFADATGDYQWIHVDVARAEASPFGGTIAHGYLTLSLLIPLWTELLEVRNVTTKVNYGLGRVRFPAPVRSGSKVRLRATLAGYEDIPGGAQVTVDAVMECDGADKPVCVAQPVFRFYA